MPSHHMYTNLIFCLFADGFFLKLGTQELFPRKIIEWGKNWQLPLKLKPEIILSALFVFASTSSNDWKEVLKGELKEWMSQESEIMNQYLVGIRNNEPISYIVSIERRWRKICTCKKISIALKKKKLCRGAPVDTHTHTQHPISFWLSSNNLITQNEVSVITAFWCGRCWITRPGEAADIQHFQRHHWAKRITVWLTVHTSLDCASQLVEQTCSLSSTWQITLHRSFSVCLFTFLYSAGKVDKGESKGMGTGLIKSS